MDLIWRELTVLGEEKLLMLIVIALLEKIFARLLGYEEKEEIMRQRYKLKDTTYSVRGDFSEETEKVMISCYIVARRCKVCSY